MGPLVAKKGYAIVGLSTAFVLELVSLHFSSTTSTGRGPRAGWRGSRRFISGYIPGFGRRVSTLNKYTYPLVN